MTACMPTSQPGSEPLSHRRRSRSGRRRCDDRQVGFRLRRKYPSRKVPCRPCMGAVINSTVKPILRSRETPTWMHVFRLYKMSWRTMPWVLVSSPDSKLTCSINPSHARPDGLHGFCTFFGFVIVIDFLTAHLVSFSSRPQV